MKAPLTLTLALTLFGGGWLLSARSDLLQAAVVENQKMCAWLNDPTLPEFAALGYQTHQRLLEIRQLEVGTISCIVEEHGFNEWPLETSLIVKIDGKHKMGLRYGRPFHLLAPFMPNAQLGFWTY